MRRRLVPKGSKSTKAKEKALAPPKATPIEEIQLQTEVVHMATGGMSHETIADFFDITTTKVVQLLSKGLDQFLSTRDEEVQRFISLQNARYNRIYREWMPRAEKKIVEEENEEGQKVAREVPGDPMAARIVLKALSDHARVCGMNKVRVEHSGRIDNTILDINVDLDRVLDTLTDDQLHRFKETKDIRILQLAAGNSGSGGAGDPQANGEKEVEAQEEAGEVEV